MLWDMTLKDLLSLGASGVYLVFIYYLWTELKSVKRESREDFKGLMARYELLLGEFMKTLGAVAERMDTHDDSKKG